MRIIFSVLLIFFLYISCTKNHSVNKKIVKEIDLSNSYSNYEEKRLSEIGDSILYIPLETNINSIIGKIKDSNKNLKFTDSLIFINDGNQLLSFNYNGKFNNKIGRQGNGPQEYIRIDDFAVLEENRLIIIKSDAQQKLLLFSFDSEFIDYIHIDWWPSHISSLKDYIILANDKGQRKYNDYYTFTIINTKGTIKNRLLKQNWEKEIEKTDEIGLSTIANFYSYFDTLSYWEFQYDTIWRILDNDRVVSKYHINIGNNKLSEKYLLTSYAKRQNEVIDFIRLYNYIETQNYIFFDIANKNKLAHIFYDKKIKKATNVKHGNTKDKFSFINDIDNGLPFWPEGHMSNNKIFSLIYGIELKNKLSNINNLDKRFIDNNLQNLVKNSTIMDNPILMVIILK